MLPTTKTPVKSSLSDVTILLYGASKIGKTELCSHAPAALFLATEAGLNHVEAYQTPIKSWPELLDACKEIAKGGHQFKTIVLDTVDNAHRFCSEFVCAKHKVEHESDLPYGKGFAAVNAEFFRVLTKLSLLPYGFIMISHAQEKEIDTRTGKQLRIVPTLPNKAAKAVLGMVDLILYADIEKTTARDGTVTMRRVIRTKPTMYYEAGDRTGRLPDTIDLDYDKFVAAWQRGAP